MHSGVRSIVLLPMPPPLFTVIRSSPSSTRPAGTPVIPPLSSRQTSPGSTKPGRLCALTPAAKPTRTTSIPICQTGRKPTTVRTCLAFNRSKRHMIRVICFALRKVSRQLRIGVRNVSLALIIFSGVVGEVAHHRPAWRTACLAHTSGALLRGGARAARYRGELHASAALMHCLPVPFLPAKLLSAESRYHRYRFPLHVQPPVLRSPGAQSHYPPFLRGVNR